ncbi:hypothetical protein EG327_009054 [Venturia inaequalis]|uniref:Transcription factor domain-containing protein n=1 Tax=Venturia inaequalis TaxID=5025 RepID=A0A8H3ZGG0_VENIN|nr:hypothetical protein EG327_009054 [Venturia inaequalis]
MELQRGLTTGNVSRNESDAPLLVKADTFEVIRNVIAEYALSSYGYELVCDLTEPKQFLSTTIPGDSRLSASYGDLPAIYLDKHQMHRLIATLYCRWGLHPRAVNIEHLHELVELLFAHYYSQTSIEISAVATRDSGLRLDSLALLLASLALGSYFSESFSHARRLFVDSTDLFNNYTGPPAFDAVATLFVQHLFTLREGSTNQAKNLNVQAIHAAHELGINRYDPTSSDPQHVELYLLLYFTDQYSSQSHCTPPTIRADDYRPDLFDGLSRAYPEMQTLIELIKLNGHVFEHIYGQRCSDESVLNLESIIGRVCEAIGKPLNEREDTDHDVLVKIHMYCSEHIEPTISHPSLQILLIDNHIPPTWRQVKRITTSAFVIIYAYWRGEVSSEEASRFIAISLLLLHCQRVRWQHELLEPIGSLKELIGLSALDIGPALSRLLPGATFDFISAIASNSTSYAEVRVRTQKLLLMHQQQDFAQPAMMGTFPPHDDLLDRADGTMQNEGFNFMAYETWLPTPLVGLFGDVQ